MISKTEGQVGYRLNNTIVKEIISYITWFAAVILISFLLIRFVTQRTDVNGSSMVPTLEDGDQLMADKLSYRFHDPERFDIIIFPFKYKEKTYFIKRIIGLPGESVRIDEQGVIYINGEVLEEHYGLDPIYYAGRAAEEIHLADDEYFVLGDNRTVSEDSRYEEVGNIKRRDLIGRAFIRIWPLNKFGIIKSDSQGAAK